MHLFSSQGRGYPATAFSRNGQATIVPKQAGVSIGQRLGLSAGDMAAVKQMYL
jgi:hypothetical protein